MTVGTDGLRKEWGSPIAHESVLVTGGGRGIGRAIALELLRRGVRTHVADRRADFLEQTVELASSCAGQLQTWDCELLDYAETAAMIDQLDDGAGPPTGLIHCAGEMLFTEFAKMSPEHFTEVVQSTLFTAFNVLHAWGRKMLDGERPGAAVVLTSALAGKGTPGVAHSCAGKAGIEGIVKTLGREWGPAQIRVNAVGPGPFPIRKSDEMWTNLQTSMAAKIPMSRFGELHEVVGPAIFLISEAAGFITGQVLIVDGGLGLPDWVNTPATISLGNNNRYE